ncbi:hypothetical protein CSOJ01_06543 [Colletotrichum sojae]|uniref:Uncharacterized protein n=1 Tax=Colletotrichum sojae TaxID=2175907 RepID=A0A8H6MVQ5_9PEZI|nr:hypothetical protein CSOJ01_06543 [Colletotrichum sojae]
MVSNSRLGKHHQLSYPYGKHNDKSHHNEFILGSWTYSPAWLATLLGKTWLQRDRFDHWALNPFAAGVKCMAEQFQTLVMTDKASGGTVEPPNRITPPESTQELRRIYRRLYLRRHPLASALIQPSAAKERLATHAMCKIQVCEHCPIHGRACTFTPRAAGFKEDFNNPRGFRTLGYVGPANVYWDITCGRIACKHLFDGGAEEVEAGREQV